MSEDPYLTGSLVAAYVTGLQNSTAATAVTGPLLTVACCKHYAVCVRPLSFIRPSFLSTLALARTLTRTPSHFFLHAATTLRPSPTLAHTLMPRLAREICGKLTCQCLRPACRRATGSL
jgi:hypothetical protein